MVFCFVQKPDLWNVTLTKHVINSPCTVKCPISKSFISKFSKCSFYSETASAFSLYCLRSGSGHNISSMSHYVCFCQAAWEKFPYVPKITLDRLHRSPQASTIASRSHTLHCHDEKKNPQSDSEIGENVSKKKKKKVNLVRSLNQVWTRARSLIEFHVFPNDNILGLLWFPCWRCVADLEIEVVSCCMNPLWHGSDVACSPARNLCDGTLNKDVVPLFASFCEIEPFLVYDDVLAWVSHVIQPKDSLKK